MILSPYANRLGMKLAVRLGKPYALLPWHQACNMLYANTLPNTLGIKLAVGFGQKPCQKLWHTSCRRAYAITVPEDLA